MVWPSANETAVAEAMFGRMGPTECRLWAAAPLHDATWGQLQRPALGRVQTSHLMRTRMDLQV